MENAVSKAVDSTNVILNLWFFDLPLKPAPGSGRKLLDNATAWAIDSTNVIDMLLFDYAILPLKPANGLKRRLLDNATTWAIDSTNVIDMFLSRSLFSPSNLQTA